MLRVIGCITEHHDLKLVLVALALCAAGNWATAILLFRAKNGNAQTHAAFAFVAAFVFSISVWATHFIAMLAFNTTFPIAYGVWWTILSIGVVLLFSVLAFRISLTPNRSLVAGTLLCAGIAGMHYTGMQALEGGFRLVWDLTFIGTSLVIGTVLSVCSLYLLQTRLLLSGSIACTALLTFAVCGVHFTGMAAVVLVPEPITAFDIRLFPPAALAVSIGAATISIIVLGMGLAYLDAYLEVRRTDEGQRLRTYVAELELTKQELTQALELADAASKSKSAFLAAMSHELRTPLNAVIGFSDIMASETFGPLCARYKDYCQDIRKSGSHLLSIINDILDISRLEAQKATLDERRICISRLMLEAKAIADQQANNGQLNLSLAIEPGLPDLRGDYRRVKQIVLNLLSNAIKFTPQGGAVTASVFLSEGELVIEILDTGIGIAASDLAKAFESFGQIDNRLSRKYEGSGLGLPLTRHLAELHGAALTLMSEEGRGTRASVRFPSDRCVAIASSEAA